MGISHLLDDFGTYVGSAAVALSDVSLEDLKLDAFERGYQAGWDDAARAGEDDTRRISSEFAQALQDLSFTYEEARVAALQSLRPLLDQIIATVLPVLAQRTLGLHVAEQLESLAGKQAGQAVDIVAAPQSIPALEAILAKIGETDIQLTAESSLADGQVYLRFAEEEREIDVSAVLTGIDQAVDAFFTESQRDSA